MMDETVMRYGSTSALCWLATVDVYGWPNVSPKEIFCAYDANTLLIANIASPGSRANIRRHPEVCVSFVDVFVQKGFKLEGIATVVESTDTAFALYAEPLRAMAGERFPFTSLFAVNVRAIEPLIAPTYRLFPDTSEPAQIQSAMRAYGVMPAAAGTSSTYSPGALPGL